VKQGLRQRYADLGAGRAAGEHLAVLALGGGHRAAGVQHGAEHKANRERDLGDPALDLRDDRVGGRAAGEKRRGIWADDADEARELGDAFVEQLGGLLELAAVEVQLGQ
jgi:hypothetical protein